MLKEVLQQFSKNKFILILILIGSIIWSLTMVRSGINYSFGLGFWGANGHDSIWHIALAESLSRGSFNNPVFTGFALQNYHLGFDVLLAIIHVITGVRMDTLYFQILPPIFALGIGLLVYWFIWSWRGSRSEAFWATFFIYFSSSFGFIVTYLRDRVITGESMFWSSQSISTLINPPYALSLIFILLGLISLLKNKKLFAILCFGVLIQIKAYAGILVLVALFISGNFSVFIGSLFINLLLFSLTKTDSLSVFIWQPFWFLETMMSYSDRLGWDRFYSAMTTYKMGRIWFKEILAYGVAFAIFIIGNMGIRIIGLSFIVKIIKRQEKLNKILIFILVIMIMAVLIPMFFVQNGTPWNTIQFFYYYLFFFSILSGVITSGLNYKVKLLVIVFAVLGSWATLQHYLPSKPQAMISNNEIEALRFLEKQTQGIVLTYPFDFDKAKQAKAPRPLYLYDSTAYVSAFTKKDIFLEDEVNLNIMGYNWNSRREKVLKFISNLDLKSSKEFLQENNIKYLYLVKNASPLSGEFLKLGSTELGLEKIFENKEDIIYRYDKDFSSN